ncbi:ankyrin [Gonapodya prolifera JEL478]|uniref:Ankyrin n=1 Tax=Gonapodya prolifera (strain JEL478) TaxID=1344416 RepID=A0A139AZU5_GONPJ|nr:ankyrin [Gonapodya prolifera JEL478]|eukprot:KXS22249.1 ankyrin [Gonapodya prolifera JEL478]
MKGRVVSAPVHVPFQICKLPADIIIKISKLWSARPLGLPTAALNRFLYTLLSDPALVAGRAIRHHGRIHDAFAMEMFRAAVVEDFRVADALLNRGADVNHLKNEFNEFGDFVNSSTPLMKACVRGSVKAVRFLCERGAKIDIPDDRGNNSLAEACSQVNVDMVQVLLSFGTSLSRKALLEACQSGNLELIKRLTAHPTFEAWNAKEGDGVGAPREIYEHFMITACRVGHVDVVQMLLLRGLDPDAGCKNTFQPDGRIHSAFYTTPLMIAISSRQDAIVNLLLQHGADVNLVASDGFTALLNACVSGQVSTARKLVDRGANVNIGGKGSALHYACVSKNTELVKLLIERGADVDTGSEFAQFSPLHSAWTVEVAQLFLDMGLDVNSRDVVGETPIFNAIQSLNAPLMAFLLDRGAKMRIRNRVGVMPLMAAEKHGLTGDEGREVRAVLVARGYMK